MAPLNDAQLAEQLVKVQDLLDRLEKLIRQQNATPDGNFEDLVRQGIFELSKKEKQAVNAGDKAKSAAQKSETAQKSQLDAKSKLDKTVKDRANERVINTARGDYWKAVEEADAARKDATEEGKRAVNKLDIVINLRLKSHTRQEQARQAQEAADRQAREAQEAIYRQAQEAQEAADQQARQAQEAAQRKAQEAQEAIDRQAHQAQEAAQRQAREAQEAAPSQIDTQQAMLARNVLAERVNLHWDMYGTLDTQKQIDLEVINDFDADVELRIQERAEDLYNELNDADDAEEQREQAERADDEKKAKLARQEAEKSRLEAQGVVESLHRGVVQRIWHERTVKPVVHRTDLQIWDGLLQVTDGDRLNDGNDKSGFQLSHWSDLRSDTIDLAIASLAVGIAKASGPVFMVATDVLQQMARFNPSHGLTCLQNPGQFILPILLDGGQDDIGVEDERGNLDWVLTDDEAQACWDYMVAADKAETAKSDAPLKHKGNDEPWLHGVGHLILVVAERIGVDVVFKISNSLESYPPNKGTVRRIIREIVRNSGWMGGRQPRFVREWQQNVPQQMFGSNACGIHAILSGWAYMLHIKVNKDWVPSEQLYEEARRLINSALRGHTTAGHIEAWMFAKSFAEPQSLNDRLTTLREEDMLRTMRASTTRMNSQIYAEYLNQARAEEIAAAAAAPAAPTVPPVAPPRPAKPPRSHVSNTGSSEDDDDEDDDAPAPTTEKVSTTAAAESDKSSLLSDLSDVFIPDEDDEESEYEEIPAPLRSSSKITAAKSKARTITTSKPKPKPARKASPPASPPPAKRRKTTKGKVVISSASEPSDDDDNAPAPSTNKRKKAPKGKINLEFSARVSAMTAEQRAKAFKIFGKYRSVRYARDLGVNLPDSSKAAGYEFAEFLAGTMIRVPLEALDKGEKNCDWSEDDMVLQRWRDSEKPPTPEPVPMREDMTNEQRRSALACENFRQLTQWASEHKVSVTTRQRQSKEGFVNALADSDMKISKDTYEKWIRNNNRMSNLSVRSKPTAVVTLRKEEAAKWILENHDVQQDPTYGGFIKALRERVIGALKSSFVDLHPPGFEEKEFPCLMYGKSVGSQRHSVQLNQGSTLRAEMSARLGKPIKAAVVVTNLQAQMLINGEMDRLKRLCSWGGTSEISHLCHNGPWCNNLGHITVESSVDNLRRTDCARSGVCHCGLTPKCLPEFKLPTGYRDKLLAQGVLKVPRVEGYKGIGDEGGEDEEEEEEEKEEEEKEKRKKRRKTKQ